MKGIVEIVHLREDATIHSLERIRREDVRLVETDDSANVFVYHRDVRVTIDPDPDGELTDTLIPTVSRLVIEDLAMIVPPRFLGQLVIVRWEYRPKPRNMWTRTETDVTNGVERSRREFV